MPLLRKKLYKEADRKSTVKNMIKSLKSEDVNIVEDDNDDIDDLNGELNNNINNLNNADDDKHHGRITDYKNDEVNADADANSMNEDDIDFDLVDVDPNFDFKFNPKKNKLTFEIDMSMGGSKLVIDNIVKDILNKSEIRNIKDVKKTV